MFAVMVSGNDAAQFHGAGAALFQRSIVKIGVRVGVQNLMGEDGRHGRVNAHAGDAAVQNPRKDTLQALDIHRFGQSILHDFAHQGMVGNLHFAFEVLGARGGVGEDCGQQVVGAHALNLRRTFLPP